MKLYRDNDGGVLLESEGGWFQLAEQEWDQLINRQHLHRYLRSLIGTLPRIDSDKVGSTGGRPIGSQEVWAAGVTYLRSKEARMEEAKDAGGGDFYDRVYDADRPELFFKATPERTVGSGEEVYIRRDSSWNVPEPELTLFCSAAGTIEGYTIGNDMSSRSIEGENPLYLPQAKSYSGSAAVGPCLYVPETALSLDTEISMQITRGDQQLYRDSVSLRMLKRSFSELVEYLFRECDFPHGVYLMTGTCLVPEDSFTLAVGDKVEIKIDPIGVLTNMVNQRK